MGPQGGQGHHAHRRLARAGLTRAAVETMTGKSREQLLEEVVSLELRMFMVIEPVIPSACQEQPEAFKLMRAASHAVLSDETLESYLNDLEEAVDESRNLVELKYARIDHLIPALSDSPLIDEIVETESAWLKELEQKYPNTFVGRSDFAISTYLRSELETYSDRTLQLYHKDIQKAKEEGRNLVGERYTYLFQQIGYDSIEAMEQERKKG